MDVVVEYDGPSLSDVSSISSFRSEKEASETSGSRSSNGYVESYRSYGANGFGDEAIDEEGRTEYAGSAASRWHANGLRASSPDGSTESGRQGPMSLSSRPPTRPPPLTGPDSAPAPALLTHSELGSRWLREQSQLVTRRHGPGPRSSRRSKSHEDDDDSLGSDEAGSGDFALVRDARGSS